MGRLPVKAPEKPPQLHGSSPADELDVDAVALAGESLGSGSPKRGVVWAKLFQTLDVQIYAAWAACVTAYVAGVFVGAMHYQTGGIWSAPLDDVFIHFDYARATARGYPFQWSEGNGYSSGNTSLLYPFVLAIGYVMGFTGLSLMKWALIIAIGSVVTYLLGIRHIFDALGRQAKYLLPPVLFSLGALNWSLMSGMENAFHLATVGVAFSALLWYEKLLSEKSRASRAALAAALAGILMVFARPESLTTVLGFGGFVAFLNRDKGMRSSLLRGGFVVVPSVVALGVQAIANRYWTGEWSQAGAIAKLALNHPYMSADDKLADWISHLKYVFSRVLHHHLADEPAYGYIVPLVAVVPLFDRRVRRYAVLLWWMILSYLPVVALNGQVRWQNERYTMPAVAWLFTAAAMGLAALLQFPRRSAVARCLWAARVTAVALAVCLYWIHQLPKMRDQIWFYGRASRNIHDQQYTAGLRLRSLPGPTPRRVLVGDAGAITYAADIPALDAIGLGGYRDLPFARAGRHGLGATLELIERMGPEERPNYMAIYPSWWGELPILFGSYVDEVPVLGNVICGGASKVLYHANWQAMEERALPHSIRAGEHIVSELDVADLMSERAAAYVFPRPGKGWVDFHVLNDSRTSRKDLFDAGRVISAPDREAAKLVLPTDGGRLIVRTANVAPAQVDVLIDGHLVGSLAIPASSVWNEASLQLPPGLPPSGLVELVPNHSSWVNYHLWIVAGDS